MADATTIILAAFGLQSSMCIHTLEEKTGLARDVLNRMTARMVRDGMLRRRLIEGTRDDYIYHRTGVEAEVPDDFGLDKGHLPMLFGLGEDDARARVTMLKHMRRRLIAEWHPALDKLIGDYERGLTAVERLRYGADDGIDEAVAMEKL